MEMRHSLLVGDVEKLAGRARDVRERGALLRLELQVAPAVEMAEPELYRLVAARSAERSCAELEATERRGQPELGRTGLRRKPMVALPLVAVLVTLTGSGLLGAAQWAVAGQPLAMM